MDVDWTAWKCESVDFSVFDDFESVRPVFEVVCGNEFLANFLDEGYIGRVSADGDFLFDFG